MNTIVILSNIAADDREFNIDYAWNARVVAAAAWRDTPDAETVHHIIIRANNADIAELERRNWDVRYPSAEYVNNIMADRYVG